MKTNVTLPHLFMLVLIYLELENVVIVVGIDPNSDVVVNQLLNRVYPKS